MIRNTVRAIEALLLALTTGWASGVNAYATVLVTGLLANHQHHRQFAEGLSAAGGLTLAVAHPLAAATVAMSLLVTGTAVVVQLVRRVRRYIQERRARRRAIAQKLDSQVD